MLTVIAMSGLPEAAHEFLGGALERAVTGLGIGTAVALLLGALVVAVEAAARRPWRKRRPRRPAPRRAVGKRGGAAYR